MNKQERKELFLDVLDELLWNEGSCFISGALIYTDVIRRVYVERGMKRRYPSYLMIDEWMRELGYSYLGKFNIQPGANADAGSFWSRHPEFFRGENGFASRELVAMCVKRRRLYLKAKPYLKGDRTFSGKEVAAIFGVSLITVRTWAFDKLIPYSRTKGGHRRYHLAAMACFRPSDQSSLSISTLRASR